jgi:hypothetical protein
MTNVQKQHIIYVHQMKNDYFMLFCQEVLLFT